MGQGKTGNLDRQTELSNCNFVKTVLMLIVVLYHSIAFWGGGWFTKNPAIASQGLKTLTGWLNTFHIYGFTLVSGYIFYYIKYEKGGYQDFCSFVSNKAKRLLIPYVFIAAIWAAPIQCLFLHYDLPTVVKNYVLAVSPSQLWFLTMLFVVFVLFWLLSDYFTKHTFGGLVVVLGLYGVGLVAGTKIPNYFSIFTALRYLSFFWLGFKLRQHGTSIVWKIPALLWILASVGLFALTRFLGGRSGIVFTVINIGLSFLTSVVGALMAFVVLQKLAVKIKWNGTVFACFSKHSMVVYLLHQQVIYFFIYFLNGLVNPYLHAAINFVGAMSISLMLASVLLKFRATRFLIGEK